MSRFPKFIGICIYFFVLITSFYHVFKFYEIFETEADSFVAFFVAIGFELSVLYFAYIYTKFKFAASKWALSLSLFIVWFGNIFIMGSNIVEKQFAIGFLNTDLSKFILAIIGSIFLPIGSFFIGKILANLDIAREQLECEVKKGSVDTTGCAVEVKNELKSEIGASFSSYDTMTSEIETAYGGVDTLTSEIETSFSGSEALSSNLSASHSMTEALPIEVQSSYGSTEAISANISAEIKEETPEVSEIIENIPEETSATTESIAAEPSQPQQPFPIRNWVKGMGARPS